MHGQTLKIVDAKTAREPTPEEIRLRNVEMALARALARIEELTRAVAALERR